jgi:hypothetical protein
MAEFDLTKSPLVNAPALLADARQNRRGREKTADKNMLLNLTGQVIGNVLQGRQVEKYNKFMNQKSVLDERAIVRSAVDNAQRVAERARTAASYTGGKEAFFREELFQLYKAKLDTNLGKDGQNYNQADVDSLAKKMASESIGEYINAFDSQLEASQNVLSTTGGDRLAYAKSLREASGVDAGVMGRGLRKLTSYFLDEDDRNTDGAVYRSVTSSQIYKASQEFKETFDKYYTQTGSALVADKVTEWETDPENKAKLRKLTLKSEFKDFKLPNGTTVTAIVEQSPDGSAVKIRPITDLTDFMSPETAQAFGGTGLRGDEAATYVAQAQGVVDDDTRKKLSTFIEGRQVEGNTKINNAFTDELASTMNQFETGLRNSYSDTSVITDERIKSIAARAILIDVENNDNRFRLSKSNAIQRFTTDNPILTLMAATEEYDGVENIPEEFRVQIDERMQVFLEQQLPAATSPARIEETIDFVQKTDIADARVGKTPILEALEIARAQAESRLAFKNKQAIGEIPEKMSFNEYLQNNAEALAEMNANIRKTEREKERQFFIDAAPTNKTLMRGPY